MSRAKRMQLVLQLAQRDEEQIQNQIRQINEAIGQLQAQIQSLEEYTQEYARGFAANTDAKSAQTIMQERGFLQQMSEAISQQKQQESTLISQKERYQETWKVHHLKCKNLENLIKSYQQEEQQLADKLEQKNMDEFATTQYRNAQK